MTSMELRFGLGHLLLRPIHKQTGWIRAQQGGERDRKKFPEMCICPQIEFVPQVPTYSYWNTGS